MVCHLGNCEVKYVHMLRGDTSPDISKFVEVMITPVKPFSHKQVGVG
jgi:hypothetical protein